ncbi:hypothetical protein LB941_06335 [Ligilactobacillus sp. WILCCON 0076]|uniref:DUF6877 domain-containing protein n=1 Tax=Ligilactobacillus ubinensis TaxID=2876789 RepID=A0A9X2JLT7_9LACO|nr:DUF6877 family protein [Ligilactobacillus ubinensis]MCP0886950.1 hypothetical protein [Ligilactobacillus ubinensis]
MSETANMALSRLVEEHNFPSVVLKDVFTRMQSNQLGNNDEEAKEAYVWQQVRFLENYLKYMEVE